MIEYFKAIQTPCSDYKVANDILPFSGRANLCKKKNFKGQ